MSACHADGTGSCPVRTALILTFLAKVPQLVRRSTLKMYRALLMGVRLSPLAHNGPGSVMAARHICTVTEGFESHLCPLNIWPGDGIARHDRFKPCCLVRGGWSPPRATKSRYGEIWLDTPILGVGGHSPFQFESEYRHKVNDTVAQLVEPVTFNHVVESSNLSRITN